MSPSMMSEHPTNEFLNTERAKNDDNDIFSAIGKQVLNLSLGKDDQRTDDDRVQVVEEIESLCMNCEENVSFHMSSIFICSC